MGYVRLTAALGTWWSVRRCPTFVKGAPVGQAFVGGYTIALVTCEQGQAEELLLGPWDRQTARVMPSLLEYGPELQARAAGYEVGEVWTAEVERMPSWKDKFGPGPWGRAVYEQMMDEGYDPS